MAFKKKADKKKRGNQLGLEVNPEARGLPPCGKRG